MTGPGRWRLFWGLFAAGWALFAILVVSNGPLITDAAPRGIWDHQVAGSAARVDEIQRAWIDRKQLDFARLGMGVDLVFIGVLSVAGVIGGVGIARAAKGPLVRALGWLTALSFLVFCGADYAETIAQFIQAMSGRGIEPLAQLAAAANPPKAAAFVAGHVLLLVGAAGSRLARSRPGV